MASLNDERELIEDHEALAEAGRSVLDRVKSRRTDGADLEWFDIPSWGGELKVQVQVLERDDVNKMIQRVQGVRKAKQRSAAGIEADLDFMVKAIVGVKAVDSETDEEQKLSDGINQILSDLLTERNGDGDIVGPLDDRGMVADLTTARKTLWYLLKYNGIALASWGAKAARWMQDTSKPVEDPQ